MMDGNNKDKNLPAVPAFSADDYRNEYLQLKRYMPSKAKKILDVVAKEFKGEKPVKTVDGTAAMTLGVFGTLGVAFVAPVLGVTGILAAPVAVPLALGGVAGIYVIDTMFATLQNPREFERQRIADELENGDLLKRYLDGMKKYKKPLPECFEMFSDQAMSGRYLPAPSAQAAFPVPPMTALLTGPFNENSADAKPDVSLQSPPPSPKGPSR